ncbi:hypothetical protein KY326_03680, partial [Candidatus Woesearchaeota archaeon]|nr:hypothetical protein [Candidatus Woesearchaeota archaeon]
MLQNRFLENVVDKMIAVYEVDHPGQAKYSLGYFAINPEDLLSMVPTRNPQQKQILDEKVEKFKKAFENLDLTDQTNVPLQVFP